MNIETVTLEGNAVRLEPLTMEHLDRLAIAADDESVWRWTSGVVPSREGVKTYIQTALNDESSGMAKPFATVDRLTGKVIGSTRFGNIVPAHRRVEIGWTWINPAWQRTAINTEAKFLMMKHAFEVWTCIRVELKTDVLNSKSRAAILRIGAREEGILRRHFITETGRVRDTIYFSVLDSEWPEVKERFLARLSE